jgi:hypothetical protein
MIRGDALAMAAAIVAACAGGCSTATATARAPATAADTSTSPPTPLGHGCAADEMSPVGAPERSDCGRDEAACRPACDAGDAAACVEVAAAIQPDPDREAETSALFRRACVLGNAIGCTNHAADLWVSSPVVADRACALRLFEATCEVGDHFGCGMQGRIILDDARGDDDVGRGRAVLERSCLALRGFPCRILALNLDAGRLGPVPPDRIRDLLREACAGGDTRACGDPASVAETFESAP